MTVIIIVVGSLIVYVISILYTKYWLSHAYRKGGTWENMNPDVGDILMTLWPGFNTFFALVVLFITPSKKTKERNNERIKKFFNLK